jgi:PilZ domain
MTASLARLTTADHITAADRRREPRRQAFALATLGSARGETAEVQIADVSEHGCAVRGAAGWLRAGGFIDIAIGTAPALPALVRWLRDGCAGMEFLRPIPAERDEWWELMDQEL